MSNPENFRFKYERHLGKTASLNAILLACRRPMADGCLTPTLTLKRVLVMVQARNISLRAAGSNYPPGDSQDG